jgi:hypothetical protein
MKPTRFVHKELLEVVRNLPCLACASIDADGAREAMYDNKVRSHPHHLISRGAGGGDVAENVLPVCVKHHNMVHQTGLVRFANEFKVVKDWLDGAGWKFNGVTWEEPGSVYQKEVSEC